jgi:hypothetical protein
MSEEKAEPQGDKPEMFVDEDWKAQAQAEKERLAKKEKEKPAAPASAGDSAQPGRGPRQLPPASFATLVSTLVTQIMFALGGIEDPQTKQRYRDLALAKHHIDMLVVLEEKTKGNLSEEEKRLLDQALYEVRMQYVRLAQMG